jgi:hypothetical protein
VNFASVGKGYECPIAGNVVVSSLRSKADMYSALANVCLQAVPSLIRLSRQRGTVLTTGVKHRAPWLF